MVRMTQTTPATQDEVDALKKDINNFVEWHMKHGPHPASVVALQELTRLVLPHAPIATRSVFTRNLTQPVVPINDIGEWQVKTIRINESGDQEGVDGDLERGERSIRCRLGTLYRLAGRFGLFALPNGTFTASARVVVAGAAEANLRFLVAPCGLLPHEVTAGSFAKVQAADNGDLHVVADGNTSMFTPRATATLHAAFYAASQQIRVVCELRTIQARAIAASKKGLAPTAESAQLGKVEFLEYEDVVPDAIHHTAQGAARQELSKQLSQLVAKHETAERELETLRARLDELVTERDQTALKVTVKRLKKKHHRKADLEQGELHESQPSQPSEEPEKVEDDGEKEKETTAEDEERRRSSSVDDSEQKPLEEGESEKAQDTEKEAERQDDSARQEEEEGHEKSEEAGLQNEEGIVKEKEAEAEVEAEAEKEKEKVESSESEEEEEVRDEEAAKRVAELDAEIEALQAQVMELEALVSQALAERQTFERNADVFLQQETERRVAERKEALQHRLVNALQGVSLRVFFVRSLGALVCASSVEHSLFVARTLQSACVTSLSLGKLLLQQSDDAAPVAIDDTITIRTEDGEQLSVHAYELDFEVLARELDASGAYTAYPYRLPHVRGARRAERRDREFSEIEIPPVPMRLASATGDETDADIDTHSPRATPSRVEFRVTPSVYKREETDVPGTGRKLVRWVSERGPDRSAASTIFRVDAPHSAFATPGDPRTVSSTRARVKDAYYNDTVSAGPQSHFEDETEWDEAARRKEAVLSGRVDTSFVVGAASRGVVSKDALASGNVNTIYYAPNPFQQPAATDRELKRYLKSQHFHLPKDASGFLEECPEEPEEEDEVLLAAPKRRASASAVATPVAVSLNTVATAAAQRAQELSAKRSSAQQDTPVAPQTVPAPVQTTPTSPPPPQPQAPPPQTTAATTTTTTTATPTATATGTVGTVQVGVAASASEPVRLTISGGSKSKTLPAGITAAQVEAAGGEEKKEKKKGLKGLFSKKDKKK